MSLTETSWARLFVEVPLSTATVTEDGLIAAVAMAAPVRQRGALEAFEVLLEPAVR